MSKIIRVFCIEGKDYLDEHDAAEYMCMSHSKFLQVIMEPRVKIKEFKAHGKIAYRKSDLTREMERQIRLSRADDRRAEA